MGPPAWQQVRTNAPNSHLPQNLSVSELSLCKMCNFTHELPRPFSLVHHLSPLCTLSKCLFPCLWITTEFKTSVTSVPFLDFGPSSVAFSAAFTGGQCIRLFWWCVNSGNSETWCERNVSFLLSAILVYELLQIINFLWITFYFLRITMCLFNGTWGKKKLICFLSWVEMQPEED